MNKMLMILVAAVLIIALVAAGPLLVIWSVNTLFPALAIPYSIWTWLAVLILGTFLRGEVRLKKDR